MLQLPFRKLFAGRSASLLTDRVSEVRIQISDSPRHRRRANLLYSVGWSAATHCVARSTLANTSRTNAA